MLQGWLWVAGCAVSALAGALVALGFRAFGADPLGWIDQHDGIAAWLQFISATVAIAITYFLASDSARQARRDADRQSVFRKRAFLLSARVVCTNLENAAERYAKRMRLLVGVHLVGQATEAYREFARLDQQMAALPLHDVDVPAIQDAYSNARTYAASAMEVYSDYMYPYVHEKPLEEHMIKPLTEYQAHFARASLSFEAEERKLPKV